MLGSLTLETWEIALFAGLGVLFSVGLAVLARWSQTRPALLAAYALIAVSFLYVGFAVSAEEAGTWIGFEMTGVAIFGTLAGLAIVRSPWFVVIGLALHPIWALYIHYYGAGRDFAPAPFVWATAGFDVAAALVVAVLILRQQKTVGPSTTDEKASRTRGRKGSLR
jgi:hypothetical protein